MYKGKLHTYTGYTTIVYKTSIGLRACKTALAKREGGISLTRGLIMPKHTYDSYPMQPISPGQYNINIYAII